MRSSKRVSYKSCGVSIAGGEKFVTTIKRLFPKKAKETVSAFSSLFPLAKLSKHYQEPLLVASTDGVGTKLLIAQSLNIHHTVGIDLVAMNTNDIISIGARPLFFLDYIACGKVHHRLLTTLMQGIKRGLEFSECQLIGGETAEMPDMYTPSEYDLAGFCTGIVDKKRIIDGRKISRGDIVIGLASSGIHSNGYSLVRKVFTPLEIKKYSRQILEPTRIYVKPILNLIEKIKDLHTVVKGIAHVTGGAYYTKATKIIPHRYSMSLDKRAWPVPEIFTRIQKKGRVSEKEMYSVFNMGIGMIVVVHKDHLERCVKKLRNYCKCYVIGEIVKSKKAGEKVVWAKKS
ncbi:MAG: phosphoribosylformylglycinamidine cyclo-ligase [Candidatus Omnitrophica bacterium]|nr:phosphoribosylformylglycinamidine cyclo-ligase [Candidatus Omnitrophota bacterium]